MAAAAPLMADPADQSLGRRLVRGTALTFGSSLLARALAAAQSILVARALDPRQVGVFAIVSYVLGLTAAFADLGLPTAAARLVANARGERRHELRSVLVTLGLSMLGVALLAGVLLFAGAPFLAALYREVSLTRLFRLGALLVVLSLLGSFLAGTLQGLHRIEMLAAVNVLKGVATLAGIVALLPALGLAGILVASIVAETLALFVVARPVAGAAPEGPARPAWAVARRSMHVATPVFLNGLLAWGGALFARSWLAGTLGYADVGHYQLADATSRLLLLVVGAVSVPLVPMIAEASGTAPARVAELGRAAVRATLLAALPPAVFLSVGAPAVVTIVYGPAYADAAWPTALLAPAVLLQGVGLIAWNIFVGAGRVWTGLIVQALGHLTLVALTAALVPAFGLGGVGLAHLAAAALSAAAGLGCLRTRLDMTLAGSGRLLALTVLAWTGSAVAIAAGATGLAAGAGLAVAVLALAWPTLRPEEVRWLRRALGLRRDGAR